MVLDLVVYIVQREGGDSRPPRRHPSLVSPRLLQTSSPSPHIHTFQHAPIKAFQQTIMSQICILSPGDIHFFRDPILTSKTDGTYIDQDDPDRD